MIGKLKNRVLISIIIGGIIYLAFTFFADYKEVLSAFSQFDLYLLIPLLFLSFLNYFVRFIKWDYYLSIIKVHLKKIDSFSIFMSGLIMSVTPGKIGELLKSYLAKEITNVPISKTAPVIFAERITDFISLLIISIIGAYAFDYGIALSIGVSVFFVLIIIIISNKTLCLSILSYLERVSILRKYLVSIHNTYESSYLLLKLKPLFMMTIVSLFAWGFECLGYYLILLNFTIDFGIFWTSFSYAFSIVAGAISMLPGGIGVTEGSLTFLLAKRGVSNSTAVATTLLVRVVTLWFAVLVGIVSIFFYQKRYGKINLESVNSMK